MSDTIIITTADKEKLQDLVDTVRLYGAQGKDEVTLLARELNRAEITAPERIPADVVTMNTKVVLSIGEAPEEEYTLVYPEEADILQNRISVLSPIGTAILGYRERDTLNWEVPEGTARIEIRQILYQPEAEGIYA